MSKFIFTVIERRTYVVEARDATEAFQRAFDSNHHGFCDEGVSPGADLGTSYTLEPVECHSENHS